jgi:hypothetical protein
MSIEASDILSKYQKAFAEKPKKAHIPLENVYPLNAPMVPAGPSGDIGLEIEVEGNGLPTQGYLDGIRGKKTGATWVTTRDGSLRGEALEYILSTPCTVRELPDLVKGLYDKFIELRTTLEPSNRCSTHVHINMTGCKFNELSSFIALWSMFEPMLIEYCGEQRKTNHFCLSAEDCADTVDAWFQFLNSGSQGYFREGLKYSALNVLPILRLGSFEVRTAPLWTDYQKVVSWGTFLVALRDYAKEVYQNPQNIGYDLSARSASEIFQDVCSRNTALAEFQSSVLGLFPQGEFNTLGLKGFRNAQPIVFGIPWDEWLTQINREYIPNPFDKPKKKSRFRGEPDPFDLEAGAFIPPPAPPAEWVNQTATSNLFRNLTATATRINRG